MQVGECSDVILHGSQHSHQPELAAEQDVEHTARDAMFSRNPKSNIRMQLTGRLP